MRIIVCTKRDLPGTLVLNELLPRLGGHEVMVLVSGKTRPAEAVVPELIEMKFLERDLPVDTLFPVIDAYGGGGRLATLSGLTRRLGVSICEVGGINGPEPMRMVTDFGPDIILSVRFSHIFKRAAFDLPRFGTYNVHPGALPRYAGLFAPFRAMLDGDAAIGSTLHRIDDGIDTGPLVGTGWLPIRRERSLLWHVLNAYRPGVELFLGLLDRLAAGDPVEHHPQDMSERRYGSMPGPGAFTAFRARGFRLYDPGEYGSLLKEFLPAGMAPPVADLPSVAAGDEGGLPCFYARA